MSGVKSLSHHLPIGFCTLMLILLTVYSSLEYPESAGVKLEGVMKCTLPWKVTPPNSTVSYEISIWNPSYFYDVLRLDVEDPGLPEGWNAYFYYQNNKIREIGVEERAIVTLKFVVNVPEDAIPGDYEITVHAEGEYSKSEITLHLTVEEPPSIKYEVDLYSPYEWQEVYPGNSLTFELYLKNKCPVRDNYLIYVRNPDLPANWTASFFLEDKEVKSLTLLPEESVKVNMVVNVPKDAIPGEYRFRFHADGNYACATQALIVTVKGIERKISLFCPFPFESIKTGQRARYLICVSNDGGRKEEILLEVIKSEEILEWDINISQTQLSLDPGESKWISLDAKPPEIIEEKKYKIIVNGSTADGALTSSLELTTKILARYLLEITGFQPVFPHVYAGEKINVVVTVRNMGESTLRGVKLNVNSTVIPNILVTPIDILSLEPKASATFTIRVSPDPNLTPGDYPITIQAESEETESSVVTIVISVSSPIPWFWISICLTATATALVVIAAQRVLSKHQVKVSLRKR
ncbi:hypothetical protein CW706_04890 [Candidatus Bathyarchaeota archaeon]|nr:MAG: hypothetical protein CW706_04890 [Candidatus Bathyarchaeota archaeon]